MSNGELWLAPEQLDSLSAARIKAIALRARQPRRLAAPPPPTETKGGGIPSPYVRPKALEPLVPDEVLKKLIPIKAGTVWTAEFGPPYGWTPLEESETAYLEGSTSEWTSPEPGSGLERAYTSWFRKLDPTKGILSAGVGVGHRTEYPYGYLCSRTHQSLVDDVLVSTVNVGVDWTLDLPKGGEGQDRVG